MSRDVRINAGGVCDTCALPRFAHHDGRCPDDREAARLGPLVRRWEAIVLPAQDAYQTARIGAKRARNRARKGMRSAAEVEAAEQLADRLAGEYAAAIRRADREAATASHERSTP